MESKNLAQNNNHIYIYIYIYIIYTYTIYIQMFKTMERLSFAPRHKDVQWWFCHRCYNIYIYVYVMGAYNGAEVCELVGIFLLYKLSLKYNKSKNN